MKIGTYSNATVNTTTSALRFFSKGKVKFVVSLAIINNGTKWIDANKKKINLGVVKAKSMKDWSAVAFIMSKFKISFIKYG